MDAGGLGHETTTLACRVALVRVLILTQQHGNGHTYYLQTTHALFPYYVPPHRVEDDGTTLPSFRGRGGLVRGPLRRVCPWGSLAQQRHLRHQHQQTRDDRGTCIERQQASGRERGGGGGWGGWAGRWACFDVYVASWECREINPRAIVLISYPFLSWDLSRTMSLSL